MSLGTYMKLVGCVSPRATITEASEQMKGRGIGAVVVVSDDHKAIGMLTDRDIVMRVVAEGKSPAETPVEAVMSRDVVTLPESASIRSVTELMRDKGVRRIPISDENGHIAGIVSFDDLLLLFGLEIGNLANAVVNELSRSPDAETATWAPAT